MLTREKQQWAKHDALEQFLKDYAPYAATQNFSTVLVNGGADDQGDQQEDDVEANLDIQYVAAMGFNSTIRYYSTGGRGKLVPDLE